MGEALGPEGTEYDLSICRHDDLPNERARARAAAVPNLFMIVASLRDVSWGREGEGASFAAHFPAQIS